MDNAGHWINPSLAFQATHLEKAPETFGLLLSLLQKLDIEELKDYRDYVVSLLGWGTKGRNAGQPHNYPITLFHALPVGL